MKASDYIVGFLRDHGVRQVFELSGGMITHLLDSCLRLQMKVVSVHHEQAAAFAADAVGRMTGVPGVALATSGPGATNLLTGIGSCYFDSSPALFITGQVNRHEQKGSRPIRQLGFQETDIVAMARPITKAAWSVQDPQRLPQMLSDAFSLAVAGRPGPVLIDIPMDVQRMEISGAAAPRAASSDRGSAEGMAAFVRDMLGALGSARYPLVLAGGGIRTAQATDAFRRFASRLKIPVVNSLMGVDLLLHGDPCRVGLIGSYGNRWANLALGRCDVLVVLGSRLDIRQTGADTDGFAAGKLIFHVDCDAGEMNNRVKGCRTQTADLRAFLRIANEIVAQQPPPCPGAWRDELDDLRKKWPDTAELQGIRGINPNVLMHQLSAGSRQAAAYVVDVGQHQMWAAQSLELQAHQRFLTSGGMGAMGFSLPAALGVAFSVPDAPVVAIAGDGCFQTNLQELQTVVRNRLPIKMVVINNKCHGMVRQFQQSYFHERYQSTLWGYSTPDFARVAAAYGIPAHTVSEPEDTAAAVAWLWQYPDAPALLQVMVDTYTNIYPKMAFGKPITEMEPLAEPTEMEGT